MNEKKNLPVYNKFVIHTWSCDCICVTQLREISIAESLRIRVREIESEKSLFGLPQNTHDSQ